MDGILARDPRVEAILTSPDDYFDRARARAWLAAGRDVATDLNRREFRRRNGAGQGSEMSLADPEDTLG